MKKLRSFGETFTPYNQIPIFEDSCVCLKWSFIFDTDQDQINSELPSYCSHILDIMQGKERSKQLKTRSISACE